MQNQRRSNRLQKIYSKEEQDDYELENEDSEPQQMMSESEENEDYDEYSSEEGEEDSQISGKKSQYLTQRQRLMQERKLNQNSVPQQYLNFQVNQKEKKKKQEKYVELTEEKRLVNEKKRKELMVKNQKQKLEEAIARILNLRDTKKVMKNNNEYKTRKNIKRYKLHDIVQKYYSNRKKTIIKINTQLFQKQQIRKNQNQKCKNCGKIAKYRMPVKFILYCSLDCYKDLKKQLIFFLINFCQLEENWVYR